MPSTENIYTYVSFSMLQQKLNKLRYNLWSECLRNSTIRHLNDGLHSLALDQCWENVSSMHLEVKRPKMTYFPFHNWFTDSAFLCYDGLHRMAAPGDRRDTAGTWPPGPRSSRRRWGRRRWRRSPGWRPWWGNPHPAHLGHTPQIGARSGKQRNHLRHRFKLTIYCLRSRQIVHLRASGVYTLSVFITRTIR